MPKRCELVVGEVFGRLTVLAEAPRVRVKERRLLCRCECGNEVSVDRKDLISCHTKSCGCFRIALTSERFSKHGLSMSSEYRSWAGMITRCTNKNREDFKDYGGRGIAVDPRWLNFESFFADMGVKPGKRFSLERLDVSQGYGPGLCIWADPTTQANNRRNTVRLVFEGKPTTLSVACRKTGLDRSMVRRRVFSGWSEEDWFKPAGYKRNKPTKVSI